MKRGEKVIYYKEEKRRKIFNEENLKIIKEKLKIHKEEIQVSEKNVSADILCDMKKMSYHIVTKSPRVKYIETILNTPSQDELPQLEYFSD